MNIGGAARTLSESERGADMETRQRLQQDHAKSDAERKTKTIVSRQKWEEKEEKEER